MNKKFVALALTILLLLWSLPSMVFAQTPEITSTATIVTETTIENEKSDSEPLSAAQPNDETGVLAENISPFDSAAPSDIENNEPESEPLSQEILLATETLPTESNPVTETSQTPTGLDESQLSTSAETLPGEETTLDSEINQTEAPMRSMGLMATGVIKILESGIEYSSLEEAFSAAQTGNTLILTGGDLTLTNRVVVPVEKNLTLDLDGNTLISQIDIASYEMLSLSTPSTALIPGSFSLINGKLTAVDVNGDGKTGGAIRSRNTNLTVDGVEAFNFHKSGDGGVIFAEDAGKANEILITNNNFHNNSAGSSGGAVRVETTSQDSVIKMMNNTIAENIVASSGIYSYGGGASFSCVGTLVISDNVIDANKVSSGTLNSGHYWSHGGGLSITSRSSSSPQKNLTVTLENNHISNNETQLYGGGIYFFLHKNYGDVLNLNSGVFDGNHSGNSGGAIDYSVHGQPTLILKNVLISKNGAPQGGGIWACPTARTICYSTLGGAILENNLIMSEKYNETGHDIRFEGYDTTIPGILTDNDPVYHRMTIQERTFLGDQVHWYADDPGDLYEPGDPILTSNMYTNRASSFGLYGEIALATDWYNTHFPEAQLIFINNTAGSRGGAISTNSDTIIGDPEDVGLSVSKKWLDFDGAVLADGLPSFVEIRLIRQDIEGGIVPLETVKLIADNNWQHTFTGLPCYGLVNGRILPFTYTAIEESKVPGFDVNYEKSIDLATLTITNQKATITIPVTKAWADADNQDGIRPNSVTIKLFADGSDTGKSLVLSAGNSWTGSFNGLAKYAASGQPINYTIEEMPVDKYTSSVSGDMQEGFIVTNSYTPAKPPLSPPQTGENNHIIVLLGVFFLSFAMLIMLIRLKYKWSRLR